MEIDIYIKALDGSGEIHVPWLPNSFSFSVNGARMASYDILDAGEVRIPNGRNLRSFSWESIFPGEGHKDLPFLRSTWVDPRTYQGILSRWYQNGMPLRLLMTGSPINHDVYLENYSVQYAGGFGDYTYSVSFIEKRDITITGSAPATATATASKSTASTPAKSTSKTYTIKSGDTLWGIAQKQLGSGAKYSQIYSLNKTIFDETAKKKGKKDSDGGHWIYPGTIIKLP